ncbi:MAG: hypothetical protein K2N34_06545, partial [Lachnospiraceae bacterium]|nr:hypothetical protein [Lachnospiraceae bacterium]
YSSTPLTSPLPHCVDGFMGFLVRRRAYERALEYLNPENTALVIKSALSERQRVCRFYDCT